MNKYQVAVAVLLLGAAGSNAAEIQGKVISVLDGDTIEILQDKQPVRIRLANIDAPEKKQPFGRWSAEIAGCRPVGDCDIFTIRPLWAGAGTGFHR